jgi:hypothetical protein
MATVPRRSSSDSPTCTNRPPFDPNDVSSVPSASSRMMENSAYVFGGTSSRQPPTTIFPFDCSANRGDAGHRLGADHLDLRVDGGPEHVGGNGGRDDDH